MARGRTLILCAWMACTGIIRAADGSLFEQLAGLIDIVVAADSSGDFLTVQDGINAVPANSPTRKILFIRNGTYREKIQVPSSRINLTMIGENVDSTIIVFDDYADKVPGMGTFESQTIEILPKDFRAMNLTFENDARPGGTGSGQNVAVSSYGDRNVFLHCRFISFQDTYYTGANGRHYFKDCYFEGAVDYIFGHTTTIFDSCQVHSVRNGSYKTAASTKENYDFGYVFFHCHLTASPGVGGVWLGRPWKTYAQTVFFRCVEYECINPLGWNPWKGDNIATCFYAEYQCTGPGSDIGERADWSHQLSDPEAADYTMQNIFSRESSPDWSADWNPSVEADTVYRILETNTRMFLDSANLDASIASLILNGEALPGWDPGVFEYIVELPGGTVEMPVIEAEAGNPLASVETEYPASLPGYAEVTILAYNRTTFRTYSIYLSIDGASGNALLDSLKVGGILIPDFDPGVFSYQVVLPYGTSPYYPVNAYAQAPDTKISVTKPGSLPGTITIVLEAVDGTRQTYSVDASIATAINRETRNLTKVVFSDPENGGIRFRLEDPPEGPLKLRLIDTRGSILLEKTWIRALQGDYRIPVRPDQPGGIYIYQLTGDHFRNSGKLMIFNPGRL